MVDLLSDENVEKSLKGLDDWNYNDVYRQIHKEFIFNSFQSATTFVQHVASLANELSHYPEIHVKESNVTITSTTADENGVTEKDIALAESIEILVTGYPFLSKISLILELRILQNFYQYILSNLIHAGIQAKSHWIRDQ